MSKKFPKIWPHFCTLLQGKSGEGHLLEYSSSPMRTPPQFLTMLRLKSIIMITAVTFRKNGYYRKLVVFVVLILSREVLKQLPSPLVTVHYKQ